MSTANFRTRAVLCKSCWSRVWGAPNLALRVLHRQCVRSAQQASAAISTAAGEPLALAAAQCRLAHSAPALLSITATHTHTPARAALDCSLEQCRGLLQVAPLCRRGRPSWCVRHPRGRWPSPGGTCAAAARLRPPRRTLAAAAATRRPYAAGRRRRQHCCCSPLCASANFRFSG